MTSIQKFIEETSISVYSFIKDSIVEQIKFFERSIGRYPTCYYPIKDNEEGLPIIGNEVKYFWKEQELQDYFKSVQFDGLLVLPLFQFDEEPKDTVSLENEHKYSIYYLNSNTAKSKNMKDVSHVNILMALTPMVGNDPRIKIAHEEQLAIMRKGGKTDEEISSFLLEHPVMGSVTVFLGDEDAIQPNKGKI